MRTLSLLASLLLLFVCGQAQQRFQLAPPLLQYTSVFFKRTADVPLQFAQAGTAIYYTTDGSEPTQQSHLFQKPIRLHKPITMLKARTFGAAFTPSETAQATFIKDGVTIDAITASAPDSAYRGTGAHTLFDNEGGMADLHHKNWLGYRQDSVLLEVTLSKAQRVRAVLVHMLQDEGNWIFLPQQVQVFYYNKHGVLKKFAQQDTPAVLHNSGSRCVYQLLSALKKVHTKKLKVVLQPVTSIPEGHAGAGQPGWLFIDEIKVY